MEIEIHVAELETGDELKAYAKRKLQFAFSGLDTHIVAISVYLSARKDPLGGCNKQCLVKVRLVSSEDILIKDTQADLYRAIDRAMQRARRSLARKGAQLRRQRHKPELS